MLLLMGFWGGAINSLSKLILFYISFIIYLDIFNKLISKIINYKNSLNA